MSKVYCFLRDIDTSQLGGDNKREAWFPKTGDGYFDPSAKRYFSTKREKRTWLARHGMREAGELINPEKQIGGRAKTRPSPVLRQQIQAYIRHHGGTEGLLQRIQQRRGWYA